MAKYILVFIVSVGAFVLTMLCGSIDRPSQFAAGGLLYFLAGYLFMGRKGNPIINYIILYLPFLFPYTTYAFYAYVNNPSSNLLFDNLPIIVLVPSAIYIGHFCKLRFGIRFIKSPLPIFFMIMFPVLLFICWHNCYNLLNTDHLLIRKLPDNMVLRDESGKVIDRSMWHGKVIVLDLWSRTCGFCIQQMPEYEKFYKRFNGRKDVLVYSLYLPIKNDDESVQQKLFEELKYDFPFISSNIDFKQTAQKFGFEGVPQFLILGKDGTIQYSGQFNYQGYKFVNNAYTMVEMYSRKTN